MCLIVDASVAGLFFTPSSDITKWLERSRGNPKLVAAGKLKSELEKVEKVRMYLLELERAGRLRLSFGVEQLRLQETNLRKGRVCSSNDIHVLALAVVSGARTLATADRALMNDFRNHKIIRKPRGSIYLNPKNHKHLLRHPKSCGI